MSKTLEIESHNLDLEYIFTLSSHFCVIIPYI